MKLGKWLVGAVIGLAFLQGGAAIAKDEAKPIVQATNKDDFAAVATAIRQQVAPGGRWEFTSNNEKADINRRLDDMQSLFDRFGTVDQMNDAAKTQLFNDQEAVNEILTKRDDQRLVCTYERPVGSHIPVKTCRTYGQIERERSDAGALMRRMQNDPQLIH